MSYTERWHRRKADESSVLHHNNITPPPMSITIDTSKGEVRVGKGGVRSLPAPSPLPLKEVGSGTDYSCKPLLRTHWKYQLFEKSLRSLTKRRGGVRFELIGVTDVCCPLLESDYLLRQDDEEFKERTVFHGTHERLFPSIFTHGLLPATHPDNTSGGSTPHTADPSAVYLTSDIGNASKHANYESQPLISWQYTRTSTAPPEHPQPSPTIVKVLGFKLLTPTTPNPTVTWHESSGEWAVTDPSLLLPQLVLTLQVELV
eukprot:TRINITY_DN34544_c0_g1_i1.p1 TRINITY_DN34544_c0_g1~~TRINITY_DN34544_c0_g1_i1.p1  ORF type:complete len:287 (+),score=60.38 TRINITY_DN34544_c0_g1_i1:86-862(+)